MLTTQYLANAGAMLTLILGLLGLLHPALIARLVSIQPIGSTGVAEVRATYGGFFVALGGLCLYAQSATIFFVVGVAWFGAAAGRMLSMLLDRNYAAKNLAGVLVEAGIGALLLAGGI